MAANRVLIGGGTGFIGRNLVRLLQKKGYVSTIVSRMPGIRRMTWHDLEKNGIPDNITAVVNMAGQNVLDPSRRWTAGFKQNCWNSRINTTKSLAKAIEAAPSVKAFINISGVSHYKPSNQRIYNENDEVEGFDFMSRLCMEWEKAAQLSELANDHCRLVKLRTGVVVGKGGGLVQSMLLPFKLGLGGPMGSGKQVMPWIHITDLCQLILHSIENDQVKGVVNAVAPHALTNAEFSKTFAGVLRRPCFLAVPEFVVHALFGTDRAALLLSGAKIEPKAAVKSGFVFKYPTAQAACEDVIRN